MIEPFSEPSFRREGDASQINTNAVRFWTDIRKRAEKHCGGPQNQDTFDSFSVRHQDMLYKLFKHDLFNDYINDVSENLFFLSEQWTHTTLCEKN